MNENASYFRCGKKEGGCTPNKNVMAYAVLDMSPKRVASAAQQTFGLFCEQAKTWSLANRVQGGM